MKFWRQMDHLNIFAQSLLSCWFQLCLEHAFREEWRKFQFLSSICWVWVCDLWSRYTTDVFFSTSIILLIVARLHSCKTANLVYSQKGHDLRLISLAAAVDLNPCSSTWHRVWYSQEACWHCATDFQHRESVFGFSHTHTLLFPKPFRCSSSLFSK